MMPALSPLDGSDTTFQACLPPVGFVDVKALPWLSPVMQRFDRQVTAESSRGTMVSTSVLVHVFAPPAGFREVSTYPFESTATHSLVDAQASAVTALSRCTFFQLFPNARGVFDVRRFPASSMATQNDVVGHLITTSARVSIGRGVDQASPGAVAAVADERCGDAWDRGVAAAKPAGVATATTTPTARAAIVVTMPSPCRARTIESTPRTPPSIPPPHARSSALDHRRQRRPDDQGTHTTGGRS
jgi:hypothetical protein